MIRIEHLSETEIEKIGEAYADFRYEDDEAGLIRYYRGRENVKAYICDYARAMIKAGRLYSTSNRHEAFIAYRLPGESLTAAAGWILVKAFIKTMGLSGMIRFIKKSAAAGESYEDTLKKAKMPFIFVGMVVVPKEFQGQGYMRKALDIAFEEGSRLKCPVVLDTDARLKRDKYEHLGMKTVRTRNIDSDVIFYDLVKECGEN